MTKLITETMRSLFLITLFLIATNLFSQSFVRYSMYCYEGIPSGKDIIWEKETLNCFNYKIKIEDKKIRVKHKLFRQVFKILEYSGFSCQDGLIHNTWKCYDTRRKLECYIFYVVDPSDPEEEEIYIEYKSEIYCFKVTRKKIK